MISAVIAARNEKYLGMTLDSLYDGAGVDEVVVVLDGPMEYPFCQEYPSLTVIHNRTPQGIRPALNRAVAASHGDILLKLDAHCIVAPGFARDLVQNCPEDGVVVARRYTLDLETVKPIPRAVDYYYLSCPWTHPRPLMMQSCPWISRSETWTDKAVDDLMCFQGSMWMMPRSHWDRLGGLEQGNLIWAEHHEISNKTWLSGGRVVIDKNTWYAHPKGRVSGYRMNMETVYRDHDKSARYWIAQPGFVGLIDRFWPLPTRHNRHRTEKYFWPDDWKKYL